MRRLSLIAVLWLAGCVHNVTCKPELVINTWHPIEGPPVADRGFTIRQKLGEIESISFVTCHYND